jgi:hypothetical protein
VSPVPGAAATAALLRRSQAVQAAANRLGPAIDAALSTARPRGTYRVSQTAPGRVYVTLVSPARTRSPRRAASRMPVRVVPLGPLVREAMGRTMDVGGRL